MRTASLMQNVQFESLFKAGHSQTLVVNGMESDAMENTTSPLTYLCILLSQTLSHLQLAVPLTFFCGQHSTPGEPFEGASGLMRVLITQILLSYRDRLSLTFLEFTIIQAITMHDFAALCHLLQGLLMEIGESVVFCMIDGISWYETESRRESMRTVMLSLQSLVEATAASGSGLVLKLFVTSPVMSRYAREWFPAEAELLMESEISGDGYGFDEFDLMRRSLEVMNMQ